MTDVILFPHGQGLTDGVRVFVDELRAGHRVTVPDRYDGAVSAGIPSAGRATAPAAQVWSDWRNAMD